MIVAILAAAALANTPASMEGNGEPEAVSIQESIEDGEEDASDGKPKAAESLPPREYTAEEIEDGASDDLQPHRFYNRPGATWDEYVEDSHECRLIAEGSTLAADGTVIQSAVTQTMLNPTNSPWAGAAGGVLGGAFAALMLDSGAEEAAALNRASCMMYRGWRFIRLRGRSRNTIRNMRQREREEFLRTVLGASGDLPWRYQSWDNSFADPQLRGDD
ncbi:MAG: hypothetical protein AAGE05_10095 [Pseudomonadota bacterium]